jgi:hypothetical protein
MVIPYHGEVHQNMLVLEPSHTFHFDSKIVIYDYLVCDRKLMTTQNKWPISLEGGHDDAGYEHMFVDIVPCDDLRFNDTLT